MTRHNTEAGERLLGTTCGRSGSLNIWSATVLGFPITKRSCAKQYSVRPSGRIITGPRPEARARSMKRLASFVNTRSKRTRIVHKRWFRAVAVTLRKWSLLRRSHKPIQQPIKLSPNDCLHCHIVFFAVFDRAKCDRRQPRHIFGLDTVIPIVLSIDEADARWSCGAVGCVMGGFVHPDLAPLPPWTERTRRYTEPSTYDHRSSTRVSSARWKCSRALPFSHKP
jgi:hypothetical protein